MLEVNENKEIMILPRDKDPMGAAIHEYHTMGKAKTLRVLSTMFEEDEMPVAHLFRTADEMPPIEVKALALACGSVLDVGAGAGCHSLTLQAKGLDVTAIDISPMSCETMEARGVKNVKCIDLFDADCSGQYDTILMLMNGTGIAGKIERLPMLLKRLSLLLADGGQILVDSSDLKYIYENEDGSFDIDLNADYYGEVDYQMVYGDIKGIPFDWLYVDFPLLSAVAQAAGFDAELIMTGEHYDYLARLTLSLPSGAEERNI